MRVSDLIDPTIKSWNWTAILETIHAYEDHLRSIFASSSNLPDKLVWLPTKNGNYTSRSGFGVSVVKEILHRFVNFNWQSNIWRTHTAPKIQTFIWKAAMEALPTNANLFYRGIQVDPNCKRCNQTETCYHILQDCPFSRRVWDLSPLHTNMSLLPSTLLDWIGKIKLAVNLLPTGISSTSLNAKKPPQQPITTNNDQLGINLPHPVLPLISQPFPHHVASPAPPPDSDLTSLFVISCFTYAAWNATSLVSGLGWYFRTYTDSYAVSDLCQYSTATRTHVCSALEAEAWAVLSALRQAQTCGFEAIHIFSDCQVLVKLLNSEDIHTAIHAILGDIRAICSSFKLSLFSFIPRLANGKADSVAKSALQAFVSNIVP
ncbi:unnamed protein product [Arabidopsis halleri]